MGGRIRADEDQSPDDLVARELWKPQPGPQTALVRCPVFDVLYGGARGGGKTDGLLGAWIAHANRWPGAARGILFRRTYDELDEVITRSQEIYSAGATWRPSKLRWDFPNGTTLKLRYLRRDEDASHYQGHSYTFAAIDEAGNFASPDPIDKISATLRSPRGARVALRMSANPGGPGHAWIKARYMDGRDPMVPFVDETTGSERVFIPSSLANNLILLENDPGYAKRLRSSGPPWLVAAWLNGDWNANPEGGILKSAWFRRWNQIPVGASTVVHSWDTAQKDNEVNDYTVGTVWHLGRGEVGYWLRDVLRQRFEYPALRRAVVSLAERDRPAAILIEDKASGTSLIQDLKSSTTLPIIAIEPEKDKVTRMFAASASYEAGLVYHPNSAPWLVDFEIELTTFPLAPHKDQVDSVSQFLNWIRTWAGQIKSIASGQTRASADSEASTRGSLRRESSLAG